MQDNDLLLFARWIVKQRMKILGIKISHVDAKDITKAARELIDLWKASKEQNSQPQER